jgi:hypothetical protein
VPSRPWREAAGRLPPGTSDPHILRASRPEVADRSGRHARPGSSRRQPHRGTDRARTVAVGPNGFRRAAEVGVPEVRRHRRGPADTRSRRHPCAPPDPGQPGTVSPPTAPAEPPATDRRGDPAAGMARRSRRGSPAHGRFSAPHGASPSILGRCRRPIPHNRFRRPGGIRPRRGGRAVPLRRSRPGATASGPGSPGSGTSRPLHPGRGPARSRRVAGRRSRTLISRHAMCRSIVPSAGLVDAFFYPLIIRPPSRFVKGAA